MMVLSRSMPNLCTLPCAANRGMTTMRKKSRGLCITMAAERCTARTGTISSVLKNHMVASTWRQRMPSGSLLGCRPICPTAGRRCCRAVPKWQPPRWSLKNPVANGRTRMWCKKAALATSPDRVQRRHLRWSQFHPQLCSKFRYLERRVALLATCCCLPCVSGSGVGVAMANMSLG